MTSRAEQDKIADVVIASLAIKMSDLQHVRYAKSAMRAEQPVLVVLERKLPIIDTLRHGRVLNLFLPLRLQEITANENFREY